MNLSDTIHALINDPAELHQKMESMGFKFEGIGRHRIVFSRKGVVIKIAHCPDGEFANFQEYKSQDKIMVYSKEQNKTLPIPERRAKCKLFFLPNGAPALVMEKVECVTEGRPDWSDFYDCRQVGKDKEGNWKAYDYATI